MHNMCMTTIIYRSYNLYKPSCNEYCFNYFVTVVLSPFSLYLPSRFISLLALSPLYYGNCCFCFSPLSITLLTPSLPLLCDSLHLCLFILPFFIFSLPNIYFRCTVSILIFPPPLSLILRMYLLLLRITEHNSIRFNHVETLLLWRRVS